MGKTWYFGLWTQQRRSVMQGRVLRFTLSNVWGAKIVVFVQQLVEGVYNLTQHQSEAWLFPAGDNTLIREIQEDAIAKFRARYPGLTIIRSETDEEWPERI